MQNDRIKCPECGIESVDHTFAFSEPEMARRCKHYKPSRICPNIQRILNQTSEAMVRRDGKQ